MSILVRHYLRQDPADDLDDLLRQYVEALWIEERRATAMASALVKGMGGK